MLSLILFLFISTFALLFTSRVLPGFDINDILAAFISVLIIGLMNFLIRPILLLLKVPLNFVTVGLTSLLMNALLLNVATGLIDGFDVKSWEAALVAALVLMIIQMILEGAFRDKTQLLR